MRPGRPRLALALVTSLGALVAACRDEPPAANRPLERSVEEPETPAMRQPMARPYAPHENDLKEAVAPRDPLKEADSDMKKVLERLAALGAKPLPTLSPEEARKQPGPADAVKAVLAAEKKDAAPREMAKVETRRFAGADGTQLDARIYTPKSEEKAPLPVVLYFHGGGFVIGGIDAYDASARALADESDAIVVAADYRRAPEHEFPASHEDAFAAYRWVVKDAASFGGDPARVAVAGESAGGNLAANVSIHARDQGLQIPVHQLLVYPVAQTSTETSSYQEWRDGKPLDRPMMEWFFQQATRTPADLKDWRLDLVNARLDRLPPTTIVLAEIDPLRADGEMLADRLREAVVPVEVKTYEGVTHEFFGMGAVVDDAQAAVDWAGERLDDAFEQAAKEGVPRQ